MNCACCRRKATHEVRRIRKPEHGVTGGAPHSSDYYCDTHALETWRLAGYRSRVVPLYAMGAV